MTGLFGLLERAAEFWRVVAEIPGSAFPPNFRVSLHFDAEHPPFRDQGDKVGFPFDIEDVSGDVERMDDFPARGAGVVPQVFEQQALTGTRAERVDDFWDQERHRF